MEIEVPSSSQATSFSATSFRKDSDVVMTSCHVMPHAKEWHQSIESPGPLKCKLPITFVLWTDRSHALYYFWKDISWHARYSSLSTWTLWAPWTHAYCIHKGGLDGPGLQHVCCSKSTHWITLTCLAPWGTVQTNMEEQSLAMPCSQRIHLIPCNAFLAACGCQLVNEKGICMLPSGIAKGVLENEQLADWIKKTALNNFMRSNEKCWEQIQEHSKECDCNARVVPIPRGTTQTVANLRTSLGLCFSKQKGASSASWLFSENGSQLNES